MRRVLSSFVASVSMVGSLVLLAVLAFAGMALAAAPALAEETHVFAGSFGSEGEGAGRFKDPTGVAVNDATGDVYVAGKTHNFDARALPGGGGFTLTTPAAALTITCTSLQVKEGVLLGSNAGLPGKDDEIAVFRSCKQTGNGTEPGCKVVEPIETKPLTSELVEIDGTKEPLGEELKPKTGNEFVKVEFTPAAECPLGAEAKVEGEVAAQILTDSSTPEAIELGQPAKEATSWQVKFPTPAITEVLLVNSKGEKESHKLAPLEVDGLASTLVGITLTLLASTKFVPEPAALWSPLP